MLMDLCPSKLYMALLKQLNLPASLVLRNLLSFPYIYLWMFSPLGFLFFTTEGYVNISFFAGER
jgi:hypothetical protein